MNLTEIADSKEYIIRNILSQEDDIVSRFLKLGVVPGSKIKLKRKAPVFRDPLLFDLEGTQIILTRSESELIQIEK